MKVLFAASECAPIVKIGGLGDVAASLPIALLKLEVDIRVVIPFYEAIEEKEFRFKDRSFKVEVDFAGRKEEVEIFEVEHPHNSKLPVFLLKNEAYLSKGGKTAFAGSQEEAEIYSVFSKVVVEIARRGIFVPELIHCNDWHTGIIPRLLKLAEPPLNSIATVLTVHNLAYQGISDLGLLDKLHKQLASEEPIQWDAQDNNIVLLLQGIIGADYVNTVSPSYAQEILASKFGEGLHEVLKAREGRLMGILNGIDYTVWNPATDEALVQQYQLEKSGENFEEIIKARSINKLQIQQDLGLDQSEESFLLGFVGRLDPGQKGLDLLLGLIEEFEKFSGTELVVLGTADPVNKNWEERLEKVSSKFPGKVSTNLRFDSKLARLMFGGCDCILMPSKFEPCGLPQMIGMRYGVLPIVHGVGGLKDTVRDGETGFVFDEYSTTALREAISRAQRIYQTFKKSDSKLWRQMMNQAMQEDFSWERSAQKYLELYERAIAEKQKKL